MSLDIPVKEKVTICSISFKTEILTRLDKQRGKAKRSVTVNRILEHVMSSDTYIESMVRDLQE